MKHRSFGIQFYNSFAHLSKRGVKFGRKLVKIIQLNETKVIIWLITMILGELAFLGRGRDTCIIDQPHYE